jgi:class 3 adenylate cyclase
VIELRGDEALAVFSSPRDAFRAAVELQLTFADEVALDPLLPLRVGIGLDAGEAVAVDGGYRGGALNLAARLCSRARAGEVWVSQGVAHVARAVPELRLHEHGEVEMKGLAEPVRVFRAPPAGLAPDISPRGSTTSTVRCGRGGPSFLRRSMRDPLVSY